MRLIAFDAGYGPRSGLLDGDLVIPFVAGTTTLDVVAAGLPIDPLRWRGDDPILRRSDVRLLAPIHPPSLRDFVAFEEHVEGVRQGLPRHREVLPEWYEAPTFYFGNPHSVLGPEDDVPMPHGCTQLDYELEVGIVIGLGGRSIRPEDGLQHVFGFTVFNDWSARDVQGREMKVGLGPAKGKDFANTLGPSIVTIDEVRDRIDEEGFLELAMAVRVNGTEIGRDLLSNMAWPIGDLVAYASRDSWVQAGDVLGTGTCGNGGSLAELWGRSGSLVPPPLRPGDVVEMSVERLGTLRSRVVEGAPAPEIPRARQRTRRRPEGPIEA